MARPHGQPAKLTVAQILKRNAGAYVQRHSGQAAPQVQSTLAKLSLCRTAALGGHLHLCSGCSHEVNVYNSCGDRHCPTCSGARRRDWLESTQPLILDGVDHYQVVFTLPNKLSRLALGNRKPIYDLLFTSAWSALKQVIAQEHGFESAALMVLHTWNQKLDAHAHVHAVVPGCGPAIDGSGIAYAQRGQDASTRGRYLVDAESLRAAYRQAFLKGLGRLHKRGELKLSGDFQSLKDPVVWQAFMSELQQVTWASFIQPPPQQGQSAKHVLKYLARYLSGGPISDSRILATGKDSVTILARAGDQTGGNQKQVPITLTQLEFTRRWCLHVLPSGYIRSRRYGGWSNTRRKKYLELMDGYLVRTSQKTAIDPADLPEDEDIIEFVEKRCPCCGSGLIPHSHQNKPSWTQVMNSSSRPAWYRRL